MNDRGDDTRELDRMLFFSDAIFAIAMTLLVLEIPVPEVPRADAAAQLPNRVMELGPKFFSYVLSFIAMGTYWIAHHGTFRYIANYDRGLLWLNLLLLLSISFVPFPAALVGEYMATSGSRLCCMPFPWPSRGSLLASMWWRMRPEGT